jgi:hypothetical protein
MFSGHSSRAQQLLTMAPQLNAVVTLYSTSDGGRVSGSTRLGMPVLRLKRRPGGRL